MHKQLDRLWAALAWGALFLSLSLLSNCNSKGSQVASNLEPSRHIAGLPAHVEPVAGKLSLYADFHDVHDEQLTLYLINATERAIELPLQDDDAFVKLEIQDPTGDKKWRRAQSHVYSGCGLSYRSRKLEAGHFQILQGWYPASGEETQLRYSIYGKLTVSSNSGVGRYQPVEQHRARYDRMAMQRADATKVSAVLFEGAGAALKGRPGELRRWALDRLAKLPREQADRIIDRLLAQPELPAKELAQTLEALQAVNAPRLSSYVTGLLNGATAQREAVLSELRFMPRIKDEAVLALLLRQAQQPNTPALSHIIDYVGGYRTAAVKTALQRIAIDQTFTESSRVRAQYQLEQWFGNQPVKLRFGPRGNHSDGHEAPVILEVAIINESDETLRFAYSRPTDILKMYVTISLSRTGDNRFVLPRKNVQWLTAPDPGSLTRVEIDAGEKHELQIAVMDYFELPKRADGAFESTSIWLSVALPGAQRVPDLSGGGAGINPVVR